jgi:hypothetical protein
VTWPLAILIYLASSGYLSIKSSIWALTSIKAYFHSREPSTISSRAFALFVKLSQALDNSFIWLEVSFASSETFLKFSLASFKPSWACSKGDFIELITAIKPAIAAIKTIICPWVNKN